MSKKTTLTPEAKTRLRAIEAYQAGASQREVARQFGIHQTTLGEWIRLYSEGGITALNAPLKPRPVHILNADELQALSGHVEEKYEHRISALIDLAKSGQLNETAATHGVTPQGLAKWRREYLAGKWPVTVSI